MLRINNLSLQLGGKTLFENLNLILNDREKVGIVGVNGAGKSSLLKVIVGQIQQDKGEIINDGQIAYLSQEVHMDHKFDNNAEINIREYIQKENNSDIEDWEISRLLNLIGLLEKDPDSKISEMSGGQKIKVEIVRLLLSSCQLLILDEPTNFLDIPSAEWLMSYLVKFPKSILVISHDLRLMNKAISKIWYLNEFTKKIEIFNGNYEDFLLKKEVQDAALAKRLKEQDKEYLRMLKVAEGKRKKIGKGDIAMRMREKAEDFKKETEKDKLRIKDHSNVSLQFVIKEPSHRKVISVSNIGKTYNEKIILKSVSFELVKNDRLVIIGKNGVGKSTLLKILTGNIKPNSGEYKWDGAVDYGYYSQEFEGLNYTLSLIDNLKSDPNIKDNSDSNLRSLLGKFNFSGDKIYQDVKSLSGGEKTRLAILKIFAGGYNTLVLDEPTTYLDPASQVILQEALEAYKGNLILVSHIPNFVKNIRPNKVLLIPEEKIVDYDDKYLDLVGIL